jgi:phenylalanyl-tRNA synthetase beta chain
MRIPLSWLKDYVDLPTSAEWLAERLTLAGLEVAKIEYIGIPQGEAPPGITVPPSDHLVWVADKIVLGAIHEVKPHPNADKLVLAMVDHGTGTLEQIVTGAPNLYAYKGLGVLPEPLWTAVARDGAEVFDGHSEVVKRMVLQERVLRGIPNRCMVCSAKELGMEDLEDGIILLPTPGKAPGTPFTEIMGDVILEVELTPNLSRCYSILGVAREVAALTGATVREPNYQTLTEGAGIAGQIEVVIEDSDLNPRFTAILIRDVEIKPSPMWLQRRLLAAGERPINNIVDITNYVMLEIGQPLHAFDHDFLVARANGKTPTIITRPAKHGETIKTLDGLEHRLDEFNELVCDTAGVLSLAGIMGGDEGKILDTTRNVLLEAANWNYINVRKTMFTQKISSGAGLRFSRGIHPAMAARGVQRGAELMRQLGGGKIAPGMIDQYPTPTPTLHIDLPMSEVHRILGVAIPVSEAAATLTRLQFAVTVDGDILRVDAPDHRTDIGVGIIGQADLCEEIGRVYGYDRLPNTLIDDLLPLQANNPELDYEEIARDLLTALGARETINYRLTTPEAEGRLNAPTLPHFTPDSAYLGLANPISADKAVMRQTLLNGLLEVVARNQPHAVSQRLYEIGPVFHGESGALLPREVRHLAIAITGQRGMVSWQEGLQGVKNAPKVDFYDLKGLVESFLTDLHAGTVAFKVGQTGAFHPGRCAAVMLNGERVGYIGELHPLVRESYDLQLDVFAAEFNLDLILNQLQPMYRVAPVPTQPAVYQDIAVVVDEQVTADAVHTLIRESGGALLQSAVLFDVYRGDSIPAGKKSLAYALTFQAEDRTLTDQDAAKSQAAIVKALAQQLGGTLRA